MPAFASCHAGRSEHRCLSVLGDNCDRSRRVSGAGCGLLNLAVFLIEFDSDHVAGFAILADFTSEPGLQWIWPRSFAAMA